MLTNGRGAVQHTAPASIRRLCPLLCAPCAPARPLAPPAAQVVAEASLAVFNAVVRDVLAACGVYECQEYEGTFMLAAPSTRAAVEAALALQVGRGGEVTVPFAVTML